MSADAHVISETAGQMKRYQNLGAKALPFLLFVTFLWFMVFTTRTIFAPVLPFVEDEFAITHARASSIFLFSSIGYAVTVFFAGVFSRLLGMKKSIIASMLAAAAACYSISFFHVFQLFYISTFLVGVATGLYLPSAIPLLTAYYHEKNWGKVLAIHDSGAGTSLFLAPLIATGLLTLFAWRGVFVVMGITLTLCAILFFIVVEDRKGIVEKEKTFGGNLWKRKELWFMGVMASFISGVGVGLYYIIPLYLVKELGMPSGEANTILGVSRIGGAVSGIATGFLVDRFSLRKTMFLLALGAGVTTMLLMTKNTNWMKALLVIQPCLVMGFMPALFLGVSRLFEDRIRGMATGILLTLGSIIGAGIIPYLLGLAGDLVSFRVGILVLGTLTALSSGLVLPIKGLK
jgi:MFS transporter, NNP family, nitrate/nitrite transporter